MNALNRRKPLLALLLLSLVISDVIAVPMRLNGLVTSEKPLMPYPLLLPSASDTLVATYQITAGPSAMPAPQTERADSPVPHGAANTVTLRAPDGGPGVPEVQAFTPHDANNLVDPFTGDFTFNIPLLDVGGYPVNLAYNSTGITPEEEAGFVGLGWSLNPGAISRQVRGLPDDLNGEMVKKTFNLRPDENIGINTGFSVEFIGIEAARFAATGDFQLGVTYNNYHGFEMESSFSPTFSFGGEGAALSGSLSLGHGVNSRTSAFFEPETGFSAKMGRAKNASRFGAKIGTRISSVTGMEGIYFGTSLSNKNYRIHNSSAYHFAGLTYAPTFEMPVSQISGALSLKIGGELPFTAIGGSIGGHYSWKGLFTNIDSVPAYGYLYAQNAIDGRVLLDYNREKDGAYMQENPNLPVTNFTYDLYSVTGQGFSEQFRPMRGDIGTIFDAQRLDQSGGGKIGGEVAIGKDVHGGVDIAGNYVRDETKKWVEGNGLNESFVFRDNDPENPAYEPVYFKSTDDPTIMQNPELFEAVGGFNPVSGNISDNGICSNTLSAGARPLTPLRDYRKTDREPRNRHLAWLTAQEARAMGLQRQIRSETISTEGMRGEVPIDREGGIRQPHHLSEINVTRDDGARYVYGLPAYNVTQKEVSFNASGLRPDETSNLVEYTPGVDNNTNNRKGDNHYFNAQETPPHAYAWLLTAVLSADYVDITGNGPTEDDFGTYTKFNYTKAQDRYRWRIPYPENSAVFTPAHECDSLDDMASYSYGEKEIWYLSSIETRNYIAEFMVGAGRRDAFGVLGENGGQDITQPLRKLEQIALYTKNDRLANGSAAEPIKTVFFEYDYSICPDHPASAGGEGKLTLKRLSFAYASSEKERLSPYQFYYDNNPGYRPNHSDRWGVYKEPLSAELDNVRFPYAEKDPDRADRFASAWLLSRIKMPSGDTLSIEYEADDYAFVQHKRAMEMAPVIGFADTPNGIVRNELYIPDDGPCEYLFFQVKSSVSTDEDARKYVEGIRKLYFNAMVQVRNTDLGFEEISGFVNVNPTVAGIDFGIRDAHTAWLRIPAVSKGDESDPPSVNPVSKAAWQVLRKELSQYLLEGPEAPTPPGIDPGFTSFIGLAVDFVLNHSTFFIDIYSNLLINQKGRFFRPAESFIRLNCPDGFKHGGGARVKKLRVNDAWGSMQGQEWLNFEYEQEYTYTMPAPAPYDGLDQISSGVAAYEPLIGGDENPFALPVEFTLSRELGIDIFEHTIQPFGESFFPAPTVGYSVVQVRNVPKPGIRLTATGFTQHEFYTAKDFPTRVSQTDKTGRHHKPFPIVTPFYASSENQATVTQGYVVEINNMHGKPKATRVFDEPGNQISAREFRYKTNATDPTRLDNSVMIINETTGATQQRLMGVEYDMILDAREFLYETHSGEVYVNLDFSALGPLPILLNLPYPAYSYGFSRFRGVTVTKVISRLGILEEIADWKLGSRIALQNVAWDGLTGTPVVAATQNEYGSQNFNTTLPAHWMYPDGMGMAFRNTGAGVPASRMTGGLFSAPAAFAALLVPGDELILRRLDSVALRVFSPPLSVPMPVELPFVRAWVLSNVPDVGKFIIDENGRYFPDGVYSVKILRSGRRNMQSLPVGNILTAQKSINSDRLHFDRVLDAAAIEYSDYWQTYTGFNRTTEYDTCSCTILEQPLRGAHDFIAALLADPGFFAGRTNVDLIPGRSTLNDAIGTVVLDYAVRRDGPNLFIRLAGSSGTCDLTVNRTGGLPYPDVNISVTPSASASASALVPVLNPSDCTDSYTFPVTGTYKDDSGDHSIELTVSSTCIMVADCTELPARPAEIRCTDGASDTVNPYLLGILGNWRPLSTYGYVTNRLPGASPSERGIYERFENFWTFPAGFNISPAADRRGWQTAGRSAMIDPYGKMLESKDALGRYSAELYGFGFSLVTAAAANARYHQLAFDGFEDYEYRNTAGTPFSGACELPPHFKVATGTVANINTETSHSGKRCLAVNGAVTVSRPAINLCNEDRSAWPQEARYEVVDCDLVKTFAPIPGTYFFSVWAKENTGRLTDRYTVPNLHIWMETTGGGVEQTFQTQGPIIEGWQQITDTLVIPDGVSRIEISFRSAGGVSFFDDFRIQPFNASMKTYVYDPVNIRLMAVLDENNFATIYEYDGEGLLSRTKKETEQGVVTLMEVRAGKPKQQD